MTLVGSQSFRADQKTDPQDRPVSGAELRVLELIAYGLTNEQIAKARLVSVETVKAQVKSLLLKLPASNRAHAVAVGYQTRLLPRSG